MEIMYKNWHSVFKTVKSKPLLPHFIFVSNSKMVRLYWCAKCQHKIIQLSRYLRKTKNVFDCFLHHHHQLRAKTVPDISKFCFAVIVTHDWWLGSVCAWPAWSELNSKWWIPTRHSIIYSQDGIFYILPNFHLIFSIFSYEMTFHSVQAVDMFLFPQKSRLNSIMSMKCDKYGMSQNEQPESKLQEASVTFYLDISMCRVWSI